MKRALGVAALGGGLLALSAGAASAQEVSADASARLGRPTSAEVQVCADGRVLSRLVGSCGGQAGSGTSGTVQADRGGVSARVQVPGTASADVSVGTRRSRPGATTSGQAAVSRLGAATADASADTSPQARGDAAATLSRPRAGRLLGVGTLASSAGVGLLGSSPFTLVGDPATDSLLPTGELTLDGLAGEAPAGIGILDSGPIASGNQVDAGVGDISASAPVTVCGNSVGLLGDASASCGTGTGANTTSGPVSDTGAVLDAGVSTAGIAGADPATGTSAGLDVGLGAGTTTTGGNTGTGTGGDISTGGIIAPPPGTTTPGTTPGRTDTVGTPGTGSAGTSGIPGTSGLISGTGGRAGDRITAFAPLRPLASSSGVLAFTGAASDLLALVALALLVAGALIVRAARPAAATEGGGDR